MWISTAERSWLASQVGRGLDGGGGLARGDRARHVGVAVLPRVLERRIPLVRDPRVGASFEEEQHRAKIALCRSDGQRRAGVGDGVDGGFRSEEWDEQLHVLAECRRKERGAAVGRGAVDVCACCE